MKLCTKCGAENPDTLHSCEQCKAFLPHAGADGKADRVDRLIADAGITEPTETQRELAKMAAGNSASMRLWLQQTGQLMKVANEDYDGTGACPTCGKDEFGGLTISAETMEGLERSIKILEEYKIKIPGEEDANIVR